MFKKLCVSIVVLFALSSIAHEGHDILPGALKANHGGVVKAGREINLEYVVAGAEVKLFPINHDGKDLNPAEVKLTAMAKLPKGKPESLKIELKNGVLLTQVDFKNAYRVELSVVAEYQGKKSNFKFQVEK